MDLTSDGDTDDQDTLIHNMSDGSYSMTDDKASLESVPPEGRSGGGNNSIGKDSQGKESRVSSGNSR